MKNIRNNVLNCLTGLLVTGVAASAGAATPLNALFTVDDPEGNMGGARKMCGSCCKYLEPYGPTHMGLDIEQFLRDFRHCFQQLLDAKGDYPSDLTLQPDRIPKIALPNES